MPPKPEKNLDSTSPGGIRVLSLDGGGFRGLGMLLVLQEITKQANLRNRDPADPQLKPCDIFDYIVGSSTGGLVAVLVGRLGLDCETAIQEYKTLATALFGTDRTQFLKDLQATGTYGDTVIARYNKAIDDLILKYPPTSPTFFTEPLINAKTGIVTLPSNRTSNPHTVVSFKNDKDKPSIWTTKDVIRATTAAPQYLPKYPPTGETVGHIDAAYAGPNINPTKLMKDYFGSNLGVIINIGQWFLELSSKLPAGKEARLLRKPDIKGLIPDFLNGVPEDPKTGDTVLIYAKQARLAQDALKTVQSEASLQPVLTRFDPPLGPPSRILELVDIFAEDEVKKEVQKYIQDHSVEFSDVATKLVKPDVKVPDPIPDVHPYNPALNAKKPTEILPYFNTYHVIFIVDDSSSMILDDSQIRLDDHRWRQAEQSLGPIARFTFENGVKSVDVGFMHYQRTNPFRAIQGEQKVLQIFKSARPPSNRIQRTPTGAVLKFYLDEALKELNSKVNDPDAYQKIAPTDIILLTDGEADDDPKSVIAAARKEMKDKKHNPNYIGIQIVQIDHSPLVKLKLEDLTTGEYGSMADLVPSDGTDLTSEKLQRIILGGNHPTVRQKLKSQ